MPHLTLFFKTGALRDRLLWAVWRWFGDPVDVPFWHERFYAWLTRRAMEAGA